MSVEGGGTVLICEDEKGFRETIAEVLREDGHQVIATATMADAREVLAGLAPDLILADLNLPDGDGLDLLRDLPGLASNCLFLVVTAHASVRSAVDALTLGAQGYLEKPVQLNDVSAKVRFMLHHRAVLRENAVLRRVVANRDQRNVLHGHSPAMQKVLKQACRVAERGRVALIVGESGAGKEVLARFVHGKSAEADGPFVPVNLAALPADLAEAQLFGHVRGAYTGAEQASEGLARAAAGGTLFLDEIGEASRAVQAKLLRLVDSSEILPVGATRTLTVRFRLLAASNRDLATEVQARRFREDLYHRLNVVRLEVPPLRERTEDIIVLARDLLIALTIDRGLPATELSTEAMRALLAYRWPGNVRELRNVLERALILGTGPILEFDDLPDELRDAAPRIATRSNLRQAVATFERACVLNAIEDAGGDRRAAARNLGIGLATLYRKIESAH